MESLRNVEADDDDETLLGDTRLGGFVVLLSFFVMFCLSVFVLAWVGVL